MSSNPKSPGATDHGAPPIQRWTARWRVVVLTSVAAVVAADRGMAASESTCRIAKLQATGAAARRLLICHATAARQGLSVAPTCVATAEQRLVAAFARAEASGGCATVGDAAAVLSKVQALVGEAAGRLRPTLVSSPCAAKKLSASGKA